MGNVDYAKSYMQAMMATLNFQFFEKDFENIRLDNSRIETNDVIKALDAMLCDAQRTFYSTISPGTALYRARIIDSSSFSKDNGLSARYEGGIFKSTGFDQYGSKEAPLGRPSAARNNIDGVSYLYLAEEKYTACTEIRPEPPCYVSLAEFSPSRDLFLFDLKTNRQLSGNPSFEKVKQELGFSPAIMFTKIMQEFAKRDANDRIYHITQYISDRIRKTGVDGVRYQSSMTKGTNITLFNSHTSIIKWTSSVVLFIPYNNFSIVDLNSGEDIGVRSKLWKKGDTDEVRKKLIEEITSKS